MTSQEMDMATCFSKKKKKKKKLPKIYSKYDGFLMIKASDNGLTKV